MHSSQYVGAASASASAESITIRIRTSVLSRQLEHGQHLELSDDCTLAYRVFDVSSTISMELTCEGIDEEWVGVGFSKTGSMFGEAVLGSMPGQQPLKYDLLGSSVEKMPEFKQTLKNASLEIDASGRTVMKFTKMLKEEDEVEIMLGEGLFLLYARGTSTTLGCHAERSAIPFTPTK